MQRPSFILGTRPQSRTSMIQQAGNAMHTQAIGVLWLFILSQVKFGPPVVATDAVSASGAAAAAAHSTAAPSTACSSVARSLLQQARLRQHR